MDTKDLISTAASIAKNQGFAVLVLFLFVIGMGYLDYQRRQQDLLNQQRLEEEIRSCTKTVIEYYQHDHQQMIKALDANTHANEELSKSINRFFKN